MDFLIQTNDIDTIVEFLKIFFISNFTYYTSLKIIDQVDYIKRKTTITLVSIIMISIIYLIIKFQSSLLYSTLCLIGLLAAIYSKITKNNIGHSIIVMIIALSINYILFFIAILISFFPNAIFSITNRILGLGILIFIYAILVYVFFKKKRLKRGLTFLQKTINNEYFDILILSISVIVLFTVILMTNYERILARNLLLNLIIFSIIMFITIQKSFKLYYKQKLLVQELDKTKEELANKTKEIETLEAENIEISKRAHTLTHKQKSLASKIDEMLMSAEISKEEAAEVKDRLDKIGKELYKEKNATELSKTDIPLIDDMLKFMQSECIKNKIEFGLQLKGNIHYMTNNLITKEDLETLLADHIKNAIIAVNHTDNVNRSILVKLGTIDETYGLYIYDSGIEFEKETLENLGKKPSTTHKDEGGTGMGFMNTFDTLRKCNASLVIEELNKPDKDNYTKAIKIKFNNKNEFKIESYRENDKIDFIKAEKAFKEYLKQYDLEDGKNKLKVIHTYEVVRMSEHIAKQLGLSEEEIQIAKIIALLHDIGRFEQVKLTEGFIDNNNFDHADYGAEILFKQNLIRQFITEDKYDNIIEKAIYNHNKLKIEDGINEKELLHSQIIRDADKIDNFRVSEQDAIGDVLACPYNAEKIEYEAISPKVFETFMDHKLIVNTDRKTMIDYWVCIIAFIFDFNFDASLQYIKEKEYIDKIIDRIDYKKPDTKQKIEQMRECAKKYLKTKNKDN